MSSDLTTRPSPVGVRPARETVRAELLASLRDGRGATILASNARPQSGDRLLLSSSVLAILGLDLLAPNSTVNTLAVRVDLKGEIDAERLGHALHVLAQRYEVLRASVDLKAQPPRYLVHDRVALDLPVLVFSSEEPEERRMRAEAAVAELAATVFDLTRPPLIRVLLVREAPDRSLLAIAAHHAIVDAASLSEFAAALSATYENPARAESEIPVSPSYDLECDVAVRHFQDRLRNAPSALDWPAQRPRSVLKIGSTAHVTDALGCKLVGELKRYAAGNRTTVFQVMLAAFAVTLCRFLDCPDLVVGLPASVRDEDMDEKAIGCFVDLVPCRIAVDTKQSFQALLSRVADDVTTDLGFRHAGWSRIVSGLRQGSGESPAIDILFTQSPDRASTVWLGGARGSIRSEPRTLSPFAVNVIIERIDTSSAIELDYRTDLLDRSQATRLLSMLRVTLEAALIAPATPIAQLPVMNAIERAALAGLDDDRFKKSPPPLAALLAIALAPNAGGLVRCGGVGVDGPERAARIRAIIGLLRDHGIEAGHRVAVLLERSIDLPLTLAAVLACGAAYLPLDQNMPAERIATILRDAGPCAVVGSGQTAAAAAAACALVGTTIPFIDVAAPHGRGTAPADASDDSLPAYVIYTSGSTGQPKGVEISRRSLAHLIAAIQDATGFDSSDVMLSATQPTFDIATLELLLPLTAGATLTIADDLTARDALALSALIDASAPTVFQTTPSMLRNLQTAGWRGSSTLELWCGGEPLTAALAAEFAPRCRRLANLYGPTETTIWSTIAMLDADSPVHAGVPLDRTRLYVLDRLGAVRPPELPGEIAIGGDGVAIGYVGMPELTDRRFVPDPSAPERGRLFLTGDYGCRDGRQRLFLRGRLDDQIKVRGHRVELAEIDAALMRIDGVSAAAFALTNARGEVSVHAAVVGQGIDTLDVRQHLKEALPRAMIPTRILSIDRLPLTPHGKVDRRVLALRFPADPDANATSPEVHDGSDREFLRELFARHASCPDGDGDDFYRLGGDSIGANRLLAVVRERFGVVIPVNDFLSGARSVEALAALITTTSQNDPERELEVLISKAEQLLAENAR